jgi:hypothetical protein
MRGGRARARGAGMGCMPIGGDRGRRVEVRKATYRSLLWGVPRGAKMGLRGW